MNEKNLINVKKASSITNLAESTIRKYVNENRIEKKTDSNGNYLIDKREIIRQVPNSICVFNQKGGPGKTSTSIMLADYYEKKGYKTLVVDLDPQMNTSKTFFNYEELKNKKSMYDFFENPKNVLKIASKYSDYIDIVPSSMKLISKKRDYDIDELAVFINDLTSLFKKYEIVILDCCPDINSLSKLGLLASNFTLIPFIPEPFNYDGVKDAIITVNNLKQFNASFVDILVLINSHEQRAIKIQDAYISAAKEELGKYLLEGSIPNFVGVKERALTNNIFDVYPSNHNAIMKISEVFDKIDYKIFEGRE